MSSEQGAERRLEIRHSLSFVEALVKEDVHAQLPFPRLQMKSFLPKFKICPSHHFCRLLRWTLKYRLDT